VAGKNIGAGTLFLETTKATFLRITMQRYGAMLERVRRKGYPGLPFTIAQFRERVLGAMQGLYDGFFRCQYCTGFFTLADIAFDHAIPLSRGGGPELDNLEFPCHGCNAKKGSLTPEEYLRLLQFLERDIPLGKQDVLQRLEIAVQLAAADRWRKKREKKESI
jgi:5-methylcytosine-specific restriction endonuclease McrA